jgi:hypothetical protein
VLTDVHGPEHLIALELQAGDARRSDDTPADVRRLFERKQDWHRQRARLPLRDTVRILIELQRQELSLLARQRPLRSWSGRGTSRPDRRCLAQEP